MKVSAQIAHHISEFAQFGCGCLIVGFIGLALILAGVL